MNARTSVKATPKSRTTRVAASRSKPAVDEPTTTPRKTKLDRLSFYFDGQLYMKMIPTKSLFHSSTVYDVVTRGDFFAVNLETGVFTILKAGSDANTNAGQSAG